MIQRSSNVFARLAFRRVHSRFQKYGLLALLLLLGGAVSAQNVRQLSLEEAIRLGTQNSNTIKLSQARIEEAISRYNQVKDNTLPTGSVSYTYNHAEIPTTTFKISDKAEPFFLPRRADAFLGTFTLQEVIFGGNRLKYATESTALLTQVARLDAESDKEELVYNIASAYFNLYKLQQSQQVVAQNLEAIDRQIKQAQRFFEQGLATRNDVLRFRLQRSNIELSGVDLETNRKVVVYNLDIMLGLPPETNLAVEKIETPGQLTVPVAAFVDTALVNRQEIKALGLQTKVADNQIKSIKAEKMPSVLASASAYYINPSGAFVPPANSYVAPVMAGVTVAWNFDQLWLNDNKAAEARIKKTEVEISRDATIDLVKTQVNESYQNYRKALERVQILETAIAQATENDRMVESQYQNTIASAIDRVDAETQLFEAQINLALAKADADLAYYTLLKSTGTLTHNQ
ncbi:TolC family protein [Pontibacter sp. 172403-2]|uniref:TolC family protein n=1 Tax=Pontibacter rufus TaxID=2791028 RepID=UPI0018B00F71|nr:TolC family protein [Pontibacter sp. 172403-2]MBF9254697.1 TolC family protein [Pontibacter sp. 172403-2]